MVPADDACTKVSGLSSAAPIALKDAGRVFQI